MDNIVLATGTSFHWTGTEVALIAAGMVFATSSLSLVVGQLNERRRAAQALAVEKLRIEASSEIEERRVAASAEQEHRRWVRDELRAELARVFAGVDSTLAAWDEAATTRAEWIRMMNMRTSAATAQETSGAEAAAGRTSHAAWEAAWRRWDQFELVLAGIELVGSASLVEAAADLHRSFESMRHHFRPASGDSDPLGTFRHDSVLVRDARLRLVEVARSEMGFAPLRVNDSGKPA